MYFKVQKHDFSALVWVEIREIKYNQSYELLVLLLGVIVVLALGLFVVITVVNRNMDDECVVVITLALFIFGTRIPTVIAAAINNRSRISKRIRHNGEQ